MASTSSEYYIESPICECKKNLAGEYGESEQQKIDELMEEMEGFRFPLMCTQSIQSCRRRVGCHDPDDTNAQRLFSPEGGGVNALKAAVADLAAADKNEPENVCEKAARVLDLAKMGADTVKAAAPLVAAALSALGAYKAPRCVRQDNPPGQQSLLERRRIDYDT